jgi:hypothetical protein
MPIRIPAAELYQIQEEDLRNAIAKFRENALPPTFQDSTRFDLLVEGYKRFPPKAIVALAAQRPLGRVLSSSEFVGRVINGIPFAFGARIRVRYQIDECR